MAARMSQCDDKAGQKIFADVGKPVLEERSRSERIGVEDKRDNSSYFGGVLLSL